MRRREDTKNATATAGINPQPFEFFSFVGCTSLPFFHLKLTLLIMASLRKLVTSPNLVSVLRRQVSSSSALRAAAVDISNPAQADRSTETLSDALAAKEKGPWKELNKEDKIALYRASFPSTIAEGDRADPDLGRVVFGVTVGVSVAVTFFVFLKKFVGPNPPRTLTPEWRDAQLERMKLQNMNPITGISSKK